MAMVRAQGLGRRYGDFWAMQGLDLEVEAGEVFGIIGPNGAGKSTTIKMLSGLLAPTAGKGEIAGFALGDPRAKERIGYLPEESPLYEDMTARTYLRFFADLYGVPTQEGKRRAEDLLDLLKLEHRDRKLGDLSKGNRRKVAIARALIHDPDVLIFDEPASGLDPKVSAGILDLIRDLQAKGKTILFSAHNLYHVERICRRVVICHKGRPVLSGTMADIRERSGERAYHAVVDVAVKGAKPVDDRLEVVVRRFDDLEHVRAEAKSLGGRVLDVRTRELTLEEIFLQVTG
ncbi:MAG TPA: ABC transporter ATP-binding protein [Candidatus Thermoplasmatota archaeon]|nr:ABC transporter ATP-binding protein [Candidatus Thermoplasmatota archaeon]